MPPPYVMHTDSFSFLFIVVIGLISWPCSIKIAKHAQKA